MLTIRPFLHFKSPKSLVLFPLCHAMERGLGGEGLFFN
jgi:hypothetical protein